MHLCCVKKIVLVFWAASWVWAQGNEPADTLSPVVALSTIAIQAERVPLLKPKGVELFPTASLSLGEALRSVPGVEWMATGAVGGRPVLRGHSYTRILWLLGGLPREGAYWGEDHGYETPPALLTFQPEVLLGPQSVRYGSDALGGVLRFQPKIPTRSFVQGDFSVQTNPLSATLQLAGAWGTAERFLMAEGVFRSAENFSPPSASPVWNTGIRGVYGYFTGRESFSQGFVELAAYHTRELVGLPSEEKDPETGLWISPTRETPVPKREAWRFRRDLAFQEVLSGGLQGRLLWQPKAPVTFTLLLGAQENQRREYGEAPTAPDVWIRTQRLDWDLTYTYRAWEGGLTGFYRTTTDAGAAPFLPTIRHTEGGLWTRRRWRLLTGEITLGARLHTALSATNDTSRTFYTWAAELSYAKSTWVLRLSRSFRIPSPVELWAQGYHEGAKRYELGNPALPTETAWGLELSYRLSSLELRPFGQYFTRYSFFERLPDTLPTAIGAAFTYRTRPAGFAGLEAEWSQSSYAISMGYVAGEFFGERAHSDRFVPRVPPLRARIAWHPSWKGWRFLVELVAYAPQHRAYTLYQTELPTPGYALLHLSAEWRGLTFGVQNALGTTYQPHLSFYRQWVPGGIPFPDRSFFLRWSPLFQKS